MAGHDEVLYGQLLCSLRSRSMRLRLFDTLRHPNPAGAIVANSISDYPITGLPLS